ncbi:DUF2951 family protein [Mammaliicoccus sciuri]|uniref:DUF2951 family protein n=1 Tax=Mammaliicoccus sciuri TaxID=1296 RepID=UPI0034DD0E5E
MSNEFQRADYDRRIKRLEDNDEKIFSSLDEIKKGQHAQELVNQKLDFTLDALNREREIEKENKKENNKNIRDIKLWVLGLIGTKAGSLIITSIKMLFGI